MEAPVTRGRATVEPGPAVAPGAELVAAVRVLAEDLPHLVREEMALLKLEARKATIRGAVVAALGVGLLLGSFFVCAGLSLLISQELERTWAGPVIVGGALLVLAGVGLPTVLRGHARPEGDAGDEPFSSHEEVTTASPRLAPAP